MTKRIIKLPIVEIDCLIDSIRMRMDVHFLLFPNVFKNLNNLTETIAPPDSGDKIKRSI